MTTLAPWVCLGGTEVANSERVATYSECLVLSDCGCLALEGDYVDPATDDAPWYSAAYPESVNFLGFLPTSIDLSVPTTRTTSNALDEGSIIGREELPGRIVEVQGWMIARDQQSMYYGQNWLEKVLRGRVCQAGCAGDELGLLPFCRSEGDTDGDFRILVNSALVDGPRWAPLGGDEDVIIQTAQFQLRSSMPYLYAPATVEVDDVAVAGGASNCALITTADFFEGEALYIQISTDVDTPVSDPGVAISITYTLDGTCPENRIAPSMFVRIPELAPNSSITWDGLRHTLTYFNPVTNRSEPGYDRAEWNGELCWPIIPACSSMCVCVDNLSAQSITWRLERAKREL